MQKHHSNRKMYIPNYRLREERERLGLGHKELAELIDLPDPHTVSRWERGVFFPQPHYRQRLCQLFGKSAEELGLVKVHSDESPDEASVLSSTDQPLSEYRWKVPPPLNSFIGREQDLAALCSLLKSEDVRLVNLTGPGGVGKTCLSIEVAHTLRQHFRDGACFVSLGTITDPMLVLPAITQALGIPESGAESVMEQMKSLLRDRTFLLLLDNFEQVVAAAPMLEELLAIGRGLKILVTSREVLHLHVEQEFALTPLAVPDLACLPEPEGLMQYVSVALFVQRAQAHLPSFRLTAENARSVAEICVRLDGLPLAIELAATRIKLLPPQALLARLSQGLHLLRSELRSLPTRQQTLYNTITWSYDLLDEQEQWLFRHLSVFPGGSTLEAVEEVLNPGHTLDILNLISSLIDKSLLMQRERDEQTPCFVLLETLREYGLHRLAMHAEKEASQSAHALYYLAFVELARPYLNGALQAQWLALLEQEIENLRGALAWLIQQQKTTLALRFCDAFGKFCGLRGYWAEEQHWLQAALALPQTIEAKVMRARVLRRVGHLAYRLRDLTRARSLQEESVALSRELGDQQNLAGALSGLAWIFYRQKDMASASRLMHESVVVARGSGDQWAIANSLDSLGRLLHFQGHTEEALQFLNESVSISRALEDKETLARILTTLVSIAITQGDVPRAEACAQESFLLAQDLGTRPLIALALNSLGDVALARGDYTRAAQRFEERIALARALGDRPTIALQQLHLGDIALAQGDLERAITLVQESLHFFREQGDNPTIAVALSILSDIKRMQGKSLEADVLYTEANLLDEEVGHKKGLGRALPLRQP
ncbi:MAG TPA: tetratricopeptide repeat protein [Ktedonosporobacter sp.]|nr:tetratricopeptide repeat protein [Ktedonosporobacter sp.]